MSRVFITGSSDGLGLMAGQANASGRFDAVIHNAGIGRRERRRAETEDGLPNPG